jgi:ParB/RepB/Spo0J family partition protein
MTSTPTTTKKIPTESAPKNTSAKTPQKRLAKPLARVVGLGKDLADALTTETVGAPRPSTRHMVQLPLAAIADSGTNHRENVGDVEGLAASIRSAGLLEPINVVDAAEYRAGLGQIPDPADAGKYVLVAGHRRTAACRLLKMTHIEAIIDSALVGRAARRAMLIENFQRVDLTPIEEAKAFAELEDLGTKQDEIATEVGCSQSHISKRLALLKLDEQVQAAVVAKDVTLADALEFGKLNNLEDQVSALQSLKNNTARGWSANAKGVVADQQRQRVANDSAVAHRAELKRLNVTEAKGLQSLFGYDYWTYKLDAKDLKKHKGMACLVGYVDESRGELTYYCKAKKRCAVYPNRQAAGQEVNPQLQDERDRKASMKLRRVAAAQLALHPVPAAELNEFLLEQYLSSHLPSGADAGTLATEWFKAHGTAGFDSANYYNIVGRISTLKDQSSVEKLLLRYACALRIAGLEITTWDKHRSWGPTVAQYFRELALKTGYQPTAWELNRLTTQAGIKDVETYLFTVTAPASA